MKTTATTATIAKMHTKNSNGGPTDRPTDSKIRNEMSEFHIAFALVYTNMHTHLAIQIVDLDCFYSSLLLLSLRCFAILLYSPCIQYVIVGALLSRLEFFSRSFAGFSCSSPPIGPHRYVCLDFLMKQIEMA